MIRAAIGGIACSAGAFDGKMSETMLTSDSRERGPCPRCGRLGHDDARSRLCPKRYSAPLRMPILCSAAAYDVIPGVVDVDPPSPPRSPAVTPAAQDAIPDVAVAVAPVSITRVFAREIVSIARAIADRRAQIEVLEMELARATVAYDGALAAEIVDGVVAQLPRYVASVSPDYAREFPMRGAPAIVVEMAVDEIVALGWFAVVDAGAGVLRVGASPLRSTPEVSS